MATPFPSTNRNYLIYADALSAVWAWWDMVTDPSYAIKQELDLWEILHRDPKTRQGIDQRLNDAAGREWRVLPGGGSSTPAAKLKAQIVGAALKRIPHFSDFRRRQAQAIFRGTSTHLMMGRREMVSLADLPAMHWFMLTGLKHMDPRRFVIRPIRTTKPDGTIEVHGQLHMSVVPTYQTGPVNDGKGLWYGRYVPVEHPEWLIRTVYDDEESRLGHGRGVMDALYFYHWAKQIVIREGLQGLERWAQGAVVYKIDPELYGTADGNMTTEKIRDRALEQLKAMRSRHYFVADKNEEIEVHTEGQQGGNFVLGWLEYIDRSIIAVATGASLRSAGDVGSAGGFASDAVGQDLMETIVAYDREVLAEDVRTDLIGLWCHVNKPQLKALGEMLGVPGVDLAPDPEFAIVHKRRMDPAVAMQRFSQAMQVPGFRVKKSEVYDEQGWTMPDENDQDVFEGQAPQAIDPMTGLPIDGGEGEPPPEDTEEGRGGQEDEGAPTQPSPSLAPAPVPELDLPDDLFGAGQPEEDADLFADPELVAELEAEHRAGMEALEMDPPPAAPGVEISGSGENKVTQKVASGDTVGGTTGPSYGEMTDTRKAPAGGAPDTVEPGRGPDIEIDGRKRGKSKIETNI